MKPYAAPAPLSSESPLVQLQAHIEQVFVGKPEVVRLALTTFLAGGHLLIEDVPGVGKTTLALSLAKSVGCTFQRIQFTSDLLPSDILGVSVLNPKMQEFEFKKGPLFHHVVLADELNRATPRTQSALLEAMNERQVTIDDETYPLPKPFFVVGTQNPHEHHGAFPLPESQLDRFMMRLSIGYPDLLSEKKILQQGMNMDQLQHFDACLSLPETLSLMDHVVQVKVAPPIDDYILAIVQGTRQAPQVEVGVSPRGALALRKAAQAYALVQNREYVTPDDLKALALPVLAHRLIFSSDQLSDLRRQAEQIIRTLLQQIPVPL